MALRFQCDVFLSHSSKDKAVVHLRVKRLRQSGHRFTPLLLADEGIPDWRFQTLQPPAVETGRRQRQRRRSFSALERLAPRR